MEKEFGQLELFTQAKNNYQENPRISKTLISYVSKYEKNILIIIGFVITGIVSFSLGVEKGKSFASLKTDSQLDIAARPKAIILPVSAAKQPTAEQQYRPARKEDITEYIQNYTIQVATYSNKVSAQKEADSLKRKGLAPLVLSKGKFRIICVGRFPNRKQAEILLSKLRKQYQDCHIRRL